MYQLIFWDAGLEKPTKVVESENYDLIWDSWVRNKESHVIFCPLRADEQATGQYYRYLVTRGRKPGIYTSYKRAEAQTDNVKGKPKGYGKYGRPYVKAWFASTSCIARSESRDVEIVRKSCGCCWYCGTTLVTAYGKHLGKGQRDHQTSRVNNGGNEIENLVLACERCNTAEKNSLNLEEYRAKLLALRPQDYPEGKVIFFGERPRTERHRIKRDAEPGWKCPAEEEPEIPCTESEV